MPFFHNQVSVLAFATEQVQGTPSDDVNDYARIDHIEADVSGIEQVLIEDPVMEDDWQDSGQRRRIMGLRNTEMPISMHWHGTGFETANDAQVAETDVGKLLEHALGGRTRGYSKAVVGGTPTVIELANVTNIEPGDFLAFEDLTDPSIPNNGVVYIRRIIAVDAGPPATVTLEEALPFTPAAGDKANGCEVSYIDSDVLEDSSGAPERCLSWLVRKKDLNNEIWRLVGTKSELSITQLARGQTPLLGFAVRSGNFQSLADIPAIADPIKDIAENLPLESSGEAALVVGHRTTLSLAPYGDDTLTKIDCASIEMSTGVPVVPFETTTEVDHNMQGLGCWSSNSDNTAFDMQIAPFDDSYEEALQAGTAFRFMYHQPAPVGRAWAICCPQVFLDKTETRVETGPVSGGSIRVRAIRDEPNASAPNSKRWRSKLILVRA